ncbi:hypothetical protein Tco_0233869 [Tanacetum coccineum]
MEKCIYTYKWHVGLGLHGLIHGPLLTNYQRLETIWSRPVNRVHVLDFEGLTAEMRQDLEVRLRMVYSGEGHHVFGLQIPLLIIGSMVAESETAAKEDINVDLMASWDHHFSRTTGTIRPESSWENLDWLVNCRSNSIWRVFFACDVEFLSQSSWRLLIAKPMIDLRLVGTWRMIFVALTSQSACMALVQINRNISLVFSLYFPQLKARLWWTMLKGCKRSAGGKSRGRSEEGELRKGGGGCEGGGMMLRRVERGGEVRNVGGLRKGGSGSREEWRVGAGGGDSGEAEWDGWAFRGWEDTR